MRLDRLEGSGYPALAIDLGRRLLASQFALAVASLLARRLLAGRAR